jgi:hypothetical protein
MSSAIIIASLIVWRTGVVIYGNDINVIFVMGMLFMIALEGLISLFKIVLENREAEK